MIVSVLTVCALAQSVPTDRPLVPASGIAAEGGPGTMWVNPANLAYDRDVRYGFYLSRGLSTDNEPIGFAATTGRGGMQIGVHDVTQSRPGSDRAESDLSIDYATSVKLPERIAVGARFGWNIQGGEDRNFVSWDAGAAWRPLPWFGLAAVARNINTPDPAARAQTGAGLVLRPFNGGIALGADFLHTFESVGEDPSDKVVGTLRIRPTKGLYVRGNGDYAFDGEWAVGGGLEMYFGRWGFGAFGTSTSTDDLGATLFVGTDEPGEGIVQAGNKVPVIVLDGTPPYEPGSGLLGFGSSGDRTWLQTLEGLRRAEGDPSVRALVIVFSGANLNFAQEQELRTRIRSFTSAGKPVIAYMYGGGGNGDYYVASAATKVLAHPSQDLFLVGPSAETMHLRGLFDLAGVQPQFVRRSEYKSAVEQYTATEPSPPAAEEMNALMDAFSAELRDGIATGRGKTPEEATAWIDAGPYDASQALEAGLYDELIYPDEVEHAVESLIGKDANFEDLSGLPQPHSGWKSSSEVAIVYVEGAIMTGRSSPGGIGRSRTTGSDTVVNALDAARKDDQVKAVVLRVDSPGGSSFASDEIHRAVERLQERGKPVVVSMGGYAASGGYYVACGADAIWAEPTTITGSIGVYSGKFALADAFSKVGVSTTRYSRGRAAGIDSSIRPWDDVQLARMDSMVGHTYLDFKQKVADGRGLSMDQVEEIARGHVWVGSAAREIGLVDDLGSLHDAIKDARTRAGIPDKKEVALVSFDGGGSRIEVASPVQMLFPELQARVDERIDAVLRPTLPLPPKLVEAYGTALMLSSSNEQIWMLDPWLLETDLE